MKPSKTMDKILSALAYLSALGAYLIALIYTMRQAEKLVSGDSPGRKLLLFYLLLAGGFLFLYLHIIIHEAGHLVAGLLSGWRFLSFRVGNRILLRQDQTYKWKKSTIMGTAGQCLMIPPECRYEDCPFFLYLLGGGAANLLSSGLAFAAGVFCPPLVQSLLYSFAMIGVGLGLSNLIPAKLSGIMNDGYQIFIEFPGNKDSKKDTYCLLQANTILTAEDTTRALPEPLRERILSLDGSDLSSTTIVNLLLFKIAILQEEGRYDEIVILCQQIVNSPDTLAIFKNEASCELLYYEIMGDCNPDRIDVLYNKNLQKYIKATALYPSRKRLMYAYYLLYKRDENKARQEYQALIKVSQTHPSRTEAAIELLEANRIRAAWSVL